MFRKDEAVKPGAPAEGPRTEAPRTPGSETVTIGSIGKSVVIKGELSASEDLTIEGQVEGKVELKQNILTIGPNGRIRAQVFAKVVIVLGEVHGNVTATEKVDIRDGGSVDGDIISPRVDIAEGAHFRGSVDMQRKGQPAAGKGGAAAAASQPAAAAAMKSRPLIGLRSAIGISAGSTTEPMCMMPRWCMSSSSKPCTWLPLTSAA